MLHTVSAVSICSGIAIFVYTPKKKTRTSWAQQETRKFPRAFSLGDFCFGPEILRADALQNVEAFKADTF